MSLFKPKVTAEHIGFELVKILFNESRENEDSKNALELAASAGLDTQHVYKEMRYLMAFSIGFRVTTSPALSKSLKGAISKAYVRYLQQAANDMLQKGITNGLVFYENYKSRLPVYSEAVRSLTPDRSSLVKVGNVFATYCGAPEDLLVASHGILLFGTMNKEVSKFVKFVTAGYRIVET